VRSPLSARGSLFASPSIVEDTRTTGSKVFTVGTGYNGSLAVTPTGMVAATRHNGAVSTNQTQCFDVPVPAGALVARFQLFNADTQGGSATDLDLEVYDAANNLVGASGGGTSDELVNLSAPAAGTYSACVFGFAPVNGNATFTLSTWAVGPTVGPQSLKAATGSTAYLGGTASVGVSWTVAAGNRYLGIVQFKDGSSSVIGSTLVSVDVH
jgi:hypothetical protein